MLSRLQIEHFAIIEHEDISFGIDFTAVTGETGAGKSIILDAMSLILGGRASVDMVRRGEIKATVTAIFHLDHASQSLIAQRLIEHTLPPLPSSGILEVKRVVSIHGRNHAQINQSRVSTSILREITEGLVEIVRQHESYTLLDPERHIELLDAFGSLQADAQALQSEVKRWRALEAERRRLLSSQAERQQRIRVLQSQLEHIERIGPEPDEDLQIERDLRLLHAAETLRNWVDEGINSLYERPDAVLDQVDRLSSGLEKLVHVDERLAGFYDALQRAHLELDELTHDLRRFKGDIPHDHSALIELETRRNQLEQLKAEYGLSLEEILTKADALRTERHALESLNRRVQEAEIEAHAALKGAELSARTLSARRRELGPRLSERVEAELKMLGMAQCRFQVKIHPSPLSDQGIDQVEFLISPNPGEGFKGLARIASGGELSRITLALKVVLMHSDHTPTYVFDEVDSGIGGAVAEGVGIKLKRISESRQVICITHLPQVASNAHCHLKIAKMMTADRTYSTLRVLSESERVDEVARMLGGQDLTEATLAHAREMVTRGGVICP